MVCGIDVNEDSGKQRIESAIREFIFEVYERAGVKNKEHIACSSFL